LMKIPHCFGACNVQGESLLSLRKSDLKFHSWLEYSDYEDLFNGFGLLSVATRLSLDRKSAN
jgi:hypothetical protein